MEIKNRDEEIAKADGYAKPDMKNGKKQVEVQEKKKQKDEDAHLKGVVGRTEDVAIPIPPKDNKVATVIGIVTGEPEKPNYVALSNDQYQYLKTLTP